MDAPGHYLRGFNSHLLSTGTTPRVKIVAASKPDIIDHAIGGHNIANVLGNNHTIVFHRSPGIKDTAETRAIVVSGNNSTIRNETEYRMILESTASGNTIVSCGPVTDNGSGNNVESLDFDRK